MNINSLVLRPLTPPIRDGINKAVIKKGIANNILTLSPDYFQSSNICPLKTLKKIEFDNSTQFIPDKSLENYVSNKMAQLGLKDAGVVLIDLNNNKIEPKKIKLFDNKVTVKIRPFEDYMEIESSRGKTKLNFLSKDKFNLFKDIVYNLNFTKITGQMYAEKVGVEIEKAKIKIKNYNKNKKREKKSKKNGYRKVFNQEK